MSDDLPNFHLHDPGEYFNGVTKDGKPLHFPSKEMHPPFLPWQIPPGETPKLPEYSEHHKAASAHVLRTQKRMLHDLRLCADMHRAAIAAGQAAAKAMTAAAEGAALQTEIENQSRRLLAQTLSQAKTLDELPPDIRKAALAAANRPRKPRARVEAAAAADETETEAAPETDATQTAPAPEDAPDPAPARARVYTAFSLTAAVSLGVRAARELSVLAPVLLQTEQKYAYLEADGELRQEFLQDRAVCIVLDVITKMDEVFANLGFGNWMPFRYFDQMTAFAGVMTRVLAAHGLIRSDTDPDVYRRLLEETPPISETSQDCYCAPPLSLAKSFRLSSIKTVEDLKQRIAARREDPNYWHEITFWRKRMEADLKRQARREARRGVDDDTS